MWRKTVVITTHKAKFVSHGRDMYWKLPIYDPDRLRWNGYDDANWWTNVATDAEKMTITGASGRRYVLDPVTDVVTVLEPVS